MAVITNSDVGWILSHEAYVKCIYEKTVYINEVKSFGFNPVLFDIQIPFVKDKETKDNSKSVESSEVEIIKKSYDSLYNLFKSLATTSEKSQFRSNQAAKSLADEFYHQLTRHPQSNFLGGNSSEEPLISKIGEELYLIPNESMFYCYDVKDIAEHLNEKVFDFILMDPPWWNKFIRRKRKKNVKFGYNMVYKKDLLNIPINSLLNSDGIVAVWCTSAPSHIKAVLTELFPAWNLKYITQWFWLKVTKFGQPVCQFSNSLKKQPFERIIFGVKKNSSRSLANPDKEKVIMSIPSAVHSHKPPLCELINPFLPENPKCLELFARYLLPKWTSYGNEVLKLQHISLYRETES